MQDYAAAAAFRIPKIRLISVGSRGDLHPYLALMQGKPVRLISDALLGELLETARAAMEGTDLLLVSPLCLWGYHLAEAAGCPLVVLSPVPIMATGEFPFLGFPASPTSRNGGSTRHRIRRRLNRSSYRLVSLLKWRQDARVNQSFRRDRLGLQPLPWGGVPSRRTPPAHLVDPPELHLISPKVLPRPADWKASASLTGFCFHEPRSADGAIQPTPYSPDRELSAFLESGPAPFYAGFGSMITRDPEALAAAVVEAAQQAGVRLILSPGWGRVGPARHCLLMCCCWRSARTAGGFSGCRPRFITAVPAPPPPRCAAASPRRWWRSLRISPPGDARLSSSGSARPRTASAIEARLAGML